MRVLVGRHFGPTVFLHLESLGDGRLAQDCFVPERCLSEKVLLSLKVNLVAERPVTFLYRPDLVRILVFLQRRWQPWLTSRAMKPMM